MKIIVEEYQYPVETVKDILWEGAFQSVDGKVSINYVGYYFNPRKEVNDCVFILPKVLLEVGADKKDRVFGKYAPESLVNLDATCPLSAAEREFVSSFSVWIYRALCVYRDAHRDSGIIYQRQVAAMGKGRKRKSSTLLDVVLSLLQFQKDNRDFFLFTVKNLHAGFDKINWTRTIAKTRAVVEGGAPVYLNPVNKRRTVNFDEELLVIFYSILNRIHEQFGFPAPLDLGYELITGRAFDRYLRGYGKRRLAAIKYKYFSDKALQLWELCRAFFDRAKPTDVATDRREYLLAKNFNVVFEAIVDELVGDSDVPAGLQNQEDGKRVDHLYRYQSLVTDEKDKDVFYIGDSKYYKRGNEVGRESVYKQFTYARNVIQWNLNLFLDNPDDDSAAKKDAEAYGKFGKLRDDVTEGYNVIPNFFISARMLQDADGRLSYRDDIAEADKKAVVHASRQFENRLFDRDTLLVAHYDVNFLFVVSLYARAKASEKRRWKEKVRALFRAKIQGLLQERFEFYAMTPKADVDAEQFLRENFQVALGKVYAPYGDAGAHAYYSLALDKDAKFKDENEAVLGRLKQGFKVKECPLGADPATVVAAEAPVATAPVPKRFLTHCWIENDLERYFLVGCCKDAAHRSWMFGRSKGKRNDLYNVRLGARAGAVVADAALTQSPKFLVLYMFDDPGEYAVYRIRGGRTRTKEQMEKLGYPGASGDYYCYVLEEEVTLGDLDVAALLADRQREAGATFVPGAPLYLKGGELIGYRK